MQLDKRTIREVLARKYPTTEEARQFVSDVKLDPIRIEFKGRADLTWFSILDEAVKQGEPWVRAVILHAIEQFPGDEALQRLLDGGDVHYAEGPDIASLPWRGRSGQTLEKIFGKQSALVHVSFLEVGVRRARAVARIKGATGSLGTGFLVTGDLLVTNHHVICGPDVAAGAVAHFNYQKTVEGQDAEVEELRLDPGAFFVTSREDDCTIVKVVGNPSTRWGAIELKRVHIRADDRVNIIQHPGGDQKQLSFFHNLVVHVGGGRVQYLTDTLPGSSGSPVFDKDWRLVALHHSGGWITEPGSRDRVFRNEGIHVDRVIEVLDQAH
jgi:V8-like Glu-specific endopeptidase